MADKSGFPDCTPWKNYRYPLTRLTEDTHYTVESGTGAFGIVALDIWASDDYFMNGDCLSAVYKIIMEHQSGNFIDGSTGVTDLDSTDVANDISHATLSYSDTTVLLDVVSSNADTLSSAGNPQSLYTIIPGLHFGFTSQSSTTYLADNEFSWSMKDTSTIASSLKGIPKLMDGTYTCWYKTPVSAGDTVVTDNLPYILSGNRSFTITWNGARHTAKQSNDSSSPTSFGVSLWVQGSVDNSNWVNIRQFMDDSDEFMEPHVFTFDSNALDGHDFPHKRIKIEFETGGSAATMWDHQYIQLAITPN